ncbi:MAG: hypothetical protein K0Q49_2258 [Haloplasmataceae bacterium]|jgi:hypothetical protein|nr:hypothetical protein [Haloplasmataceae bacterium]
MKKFRLTMMCTSCKWKITEELEKKGFKDFNIDMETSILTFNGNVLSAYVISVVNGISYQIKEIDSSDELTDDEIALMEYEIRNGYNR